MGLLAVSWFSFQSPALAKITAASAVIAGSATFGRSEVLMSNKESLEIVNRMEENLEDITFTQLLYR